MAAANRSAINPDGRTINISHLEREIQEDVAAYRKYKAEDGMKKRAVHTSKDYDEFRNFVSVSQLKPASGRDVSSLFNGAAGLRIGTQGNNINKSMHKNAAGGFDEIIQRRKDISASSNLSPSSSVASVDRDQGIRGESYHNLKPALSIGLDAKASPKVKNKTTTIAAKSSRGAHDFIKKWKQQCKNGESTLLFLTKTERKKDSTENRLVLIPDKMCKEFFSADIDSAIVEDVIEGLHLLLELSINSSEDNSLCKRNDRNCLEELLSSHANTSAFVRDWLKALTSCGRFDLSISFMMPEQQSKLKQLCNFIRDSTNGEGTKDEFLLHYERALK